VIRVVPAILALCLLAGSCYVQRHGLAVYVKTQPEHWETKCIEQVEVRFIDTFCFGATTYHMDKIELPFTQFRHHVEFSFRRRLSDIVQIVHNHPPDAGPYPSALDRQFLDALRANGFAGRFSIYWQGVIRDY
jgi:proteasome lid subunit RPN8/RPN11